MKLPHLDLFTMRLPLLLLLSLPLLAHGAEAGTDGASFENKVRPLLEKHCTECHGAKKQKADLRLDLKAHALKGGESGAAIVPSDSTKSPLYLRVISEKDDERMPPKGERLSKDEVAALKSWIDSGAQWPESAADTAATVDARLQHWSLQPLKVASESAEPETVRGSKHAPLSVDSFITAKLKDAGLSQSVEADRRTLIRRASLDGIGLPPTPEEVESFVTDKDPRAYEKRIDRLLASPRFGERWARHWLDVVRFAESDGFETNRARANAWPYRDYVIRAFNDDKPFDRFIREQIAGDALGEDAATGFLVGGGKDRVGSKDPVLTANQCADELHDMVSTTCATFLGLTVNCARCHDHKFDPIPAKDYYALSAMLQGVQHGERPWRNSGMPEDAAPAHLRPAVVAGANEDAFDAVDAKFLRFTITACSTGEPCIDELEVFNTNGENVARGAAVRVSGTYADGKTAKHKWEHLNDGRYGNDFSWISNQKDGGWAQVEFANAERINRVAWSRDRSMDAGRHFTDRLATGYRIEVSPDGKTWRAVSSSADRATSASKGPQVYAGIFKQPEPTHRNHRGDPMQPRETVAPGALSQIGKPLTLPADAPEQDRRVALADWIADPANPLTARVIVNRLWHYHFGTGLVDTPSDFGINGSRPTHPELLDFLAHELITHGWSLRHIHRLILLSQTYRQSSAMNAAAMKTDSGARLLWRFPPRRIEAEVLRDSMLAVSGKLDLTMGGPGFDLFEPNDNYVKVYATRAEYGPAEFRRMVYQSKPRTMLDDFFGTFDCPDAGQPAPRRTSSTTPLQALNLLNSSFALQQAGFLVERLKKDAGENAGAQVQRAFALMFNRAPSPDEITDSTALIAQHGLPAFCRALFNANEFIRLD